MSTLWLLRRVLGPSRNFAGFRRSVLSHMHENVWPALRLFWGGVREVEGRVGQRGLTCCPGSAVHRARFKIGLLPPVCCKLRALRMPLPARPPAHSPTSDGPSVQLPGQVSTRCYRCTGTGRPCKAPFGLILAPFLTWFSALCYPTRAVCHALPNVYACWVLGADWCLQSDVLPIHVARSWILTIWAIGSFLVFFLVRVMGVRAVSA